MPEIGAARPGASGLPRKLLSVYAMALVKDAVFEPDRLRLSSTTCVRKLRNIRHKYGRLLVGEPAIQDSQTVGSRPWDYPTHEITLAVVELFREGLASGSVGPGNRTRNPWTSDTIIEVVREYTSNASDYSVHEACVDEIDRVLTALRLISETPVSLIGPVTLEFEDINGNDRPIPVIGQFAFDDQRPTHQKDRHSIVAFDKSLLRKLIQVYKSLEAIPGFLSVPIRRLQLSSSRGFLEDQFIDSMIGLESLYLGDSGGELKFRLQNRIACHLATDKSDWKSLFEATGVAYDLRSRLVHGAVVSLSSALEKKKSRFSDDRQVVSWARKSLAKGCRKVLCSKSRLLWRQDRQQLDLIRGAVLHRRKSDTRT